MENDIGQSSSGPPQSPSCADNDNNDAGDFECNICFDLAQDPIVTLCGHLFCWPCLYRWLHFHSHSHECPVCKAIIQEDKLVPLYGRGKTQTDPRTKPIPGIEIPRRPAGQRPETVPPVSNNIPNFGFGLMGGFVPMATARFGNFAFSAGFGGLFPSLSNFHFHGYPDATVYGTTSGYTNMFSGGYHGAHVRSRRTQETNPAEQENNVLKNILIIIGILLILSLIWS